MSLRSNRSFIGLISGRLITNAGDSIYLIAVMWLVYDLTGSATYTGIAGFLTFGAQSIQFLAGPLVDRWNLKSVLVCTQLLQGVGVLVIPIANWFGLLNVWVLLTVIPTLALINQFVYPAQNAALPRIVDQEELIKANSALSFSYQGVDIAFNAISGILIVVVGATTLFLIDSVTFFVAGILFAAIVIPKVELEESEKQSSNNKTRTEEEESAIGTDKPADRMKEEENKFGIEQYKTELKAGVDYLRGSILLEIIIGATVINFGFGMLIAALPALASAIGGPEYYGLLMAGLSGGTLIGAVGASVVDDLPVGAVYATSFLISGGCLAFVTLVANQWMVLGFFVAAFIPPGAAQVIASSVLQSTVNDSILARVSSVQASLSTSMMPVGSLIGGIIAEQTAPINSIMVMAILVSITGLYFVLQKRIRSLPAVSEIKPADLELTT